MNIKILKKIHQEGEVSAIQEVC